MTLSYRSLTPGAARVAVPSALLAAVLLSLAAAPATAQRDSEYRSRIDTSFAFDKNGTLSVTNRSGDVIVTAWPRNEIRVRATSESDNVRLDATSNRVSLEVGGWHGHGDTRFEVTVPYGVRVQARVQSGDLSIRGTRGEVEATSQSGDMIIEDVQTRLEVNGLSGDLRVRGVNGSTSITLISGDVSLDDATGDVDITSVSGDITMHGIVAKSVHAKTTSGDVEYDGTIDRTGRYEFVTHSGDVGFALPTQASATLTVSTWNGDIESDFPITLAPGEHGIGISTAKRFTFDVGGGNGARIVAESFSGDITIRRR